jgi:NADPH:quinone reductase-like Zn-dependent oxidoreductase
MARVVRFHQLGGPEVLRIEDVSIPEPGRHEVRIRVKALGLNRADALLRSGAYIEVPTFPSGLGLEAAGIVERVGEDVEGFAPGDAVSVIPPKSMTRWPAYGELAAFPAALLVKHPPSLSWEEAAATWMQYLTAYGGLVDIGRLGEIAAQSSEATKSPMYSQYCRTCRTGWSLAPPGCPGTRTLVGSSSRDSASLHCLSSTTT